MSVRVRYIGKERQPIVTIDSFAGRVNDIIDTAARMRPFGKSQNYYPGLRRIITADDVEASRYVDFCLRRVAPMLGRTFGAKSFSCLEASFSMVTTAPLDLTTSQKAPHFDSLDPNYIAILHYLAECPGTAFYRQRSTGIEMLTADNHKRYRDGLSPDEDDWEGYIAGSNTSYEQIDLVTGAIDRIAIYRGALLHSGIITDDLSLSDDPHEGRLTANFFIHVE